MAVTQLVYTSRSMCAVDDTVLAAIQEVAIRHNREHDITGILMYGGGRFIQLLEGPLDDVNALYECIERDERHTDLSIVYRTVATERYFPDWSMGVVNMAHDSLEFSVRELWKELDVDRLVDAADHSDLLIELFRAFQRHVATMPLLV